MDDECGKLIVVTNTKDADGFPVETLHKTDVYLEEKSATRSEFYEAMRNGIQVKKVFTVREEDWEGAVQTLGGRKVYPTILEHDGTIYEIVRTFGKGKSKIEITCR